MPSIEKLQLSYLPMDPAPTSNKIFFNDLAFSLGIYVVSFLMVFFFGIKILQFEIPSTSHNFMFTPTLELSNAV